MTRAARARPGGTSRARSAVWLAALLVPVLVVIALIGGGASDGDAGHEAGAAASPHASDDQHALASAGGRADPSGGGHDMRRVFPEVEEIYDSLTASGVKVEFTVKSEDFFFGPKNVESGGLATVKLRITDETTSAARENIVPRAWIEAVSDPQATSDERCSSRVAAFARGGLTDRPLVDLNSFFVLALNQEPTISVIDPLVNFGGMTQLYAMLELPSPGADWALSDDQQLLVVTSPASGAVSVASTASFDVIGTVELGGAPVHVRLQPDGRYAWVTNDADDPDVGGLSLVDTGSLDVVAHLSIGNGHHELALAPDGTRAYVSSRDSGTIAAVDTAGRRVANEAAVGAAPAAIAVSPRDGALWVGDGSSGVVRVLDPASLATRREVPTLGGVSSLRFSPDGGWVFATSPTTGRVTVIDARRDSAPRGVSIAGAPDLVVFSDTAAYIHLRDRAALGVVQLAELNGAAPIELTELSYGSQQRPPGAGGGALADPIATTPGEPALLIADPGEGEIAYHLEGADAPAGSLQNYNRVPVAVGVVNRGFEEEAPGIYSARFRVPESGSFDVAVLLDSPRVIHCFRFTAREDATAAVTPGRVPELTLAEALPTMRAGSEVRLLVRLEDGVTGESITDATDLVAVVGETSGGWSARAVAVPVGDGTYEVGITLPRAGTYNLIFSLSSLGAGPQDLPAWTLTVGGD